jgi:hypothetical protein
VKTLLLTLDQWDLCLDSSGNIAVATDPYSVAQDVASACRTFLGECWYNTTLGVPYFQDVLGQLPPIALLKQLLSDAALTVPGCTNPAVYISGIVGRKVSGQVQFTDANGSTQAVGF